MKEWARRGIFALAIWAMIVGLLRAAGFAPHFVLIAVAVITGTTAFWFVADVGSIVHSAGWGAESNAPPEGHGGDLRAERLQRDVTQLLTTDGHENVTPLLIELIDDRVSAVHGVDRHTDPAGFAALVGPELATFVTTPIGSAGRRRGKMSPRSLADIVGRIEAL